MFETYLEITISMTIIILAVIILSKTVLKIYNVKWKYIIWLCIAFRLLIPVNYTSVKSLITIIAPETKIGMTFDISDNGGFNYPMKIYTTTPLETPSDTKDEQKNDVSFNQNAEQAQSEKIVNEISIMSLMKIIWIIGIILFTLFYIINYITFILRIKSSLVEVNSTVFDNVKKELNIRENINLYKCDLIQSPVLIGFFKPKILMPKMVYDENELSLIFTHELTHYRRKDLWYKLLLVSANIVHWFNPFVYIMRRCADKDIEYTCDDEVIKKLSLNDRKIYSKVILKTMKNERS